MYRNYSKGKSIYQYKVYISIGINFISMGWVEWGGG